MSDKVTFTDIGGKTHTTDSSTYKKWEKAGNVKSSDYQAPPPRTPDSKPETKTVTYRDSSGKTKTTNLVTFIDTSGKEKTMTEGSYQLALNTGVAKPYTGVKLGDGTSTIGPETVDLMYQDKLAKGEITQEEYNQAISASYASEGTLLYTQALARDDKQLQKTAEERITDYIKMGKTTPQEIQTQLNQPYAQENYNYFKSGIINVNLPLQTQTITHTYAPLSNLYPQDLSSKKQIDLMNAITTEYNTQAGSNLVLFVVENGAISLNPNLSEGLKERVTNLAEQRGLILDSKVNVSSVPNTSLYTSSGESNSNSIFFTEVEYNNNIDTSKLHGRDFNKDVLYETVGDKDIPRYKLVDGEYKPLTEINGQYIYIPEGYKYSSEGFLLPKDVQVTKDGTYYQGDVFLKKDSGVLVPDYKVSVTTDDLNKMSKVEKDYFKQVNGEYIIEKSYTTTTTKVILPDNFVKVKQTLDLPKSMDKGGLLSSYKSPDVYKNTITDIHYKGVGDNLVPYYKIDNGEKQYYKKFMDKYYLGIEKINTDTTPAHIKKAKENIFMMKELDKVYGYSIPDELKGVSNFIGNVRDEIYMNFVKGKYDYENFYDTTISNNMRLASNIVPILSTGVTISESLEYTFGTNPASQILRRGKQVYDDVAIDLVGVIYKTPSKIIGNVAIGSYDFDLYNKQVLLGKQFEQDIQKVDIKIPFTKSSISFDTSRSGLDATVLSGEAGLYITSILTGGLTGVSQKSVLTSDPSTAGKTVSSVPQILKAGGIGAGFGLVTVGYDISLGTEVSLDDALTRVSKSAGMAMGFVGLSELSRVTVLEGPQKVQNLLFEKVDLLVRDKGLFGFHEHFVTEDMTYEWVANVQRTQYKPFIRDLFVAEKDVFINLPFERINYLGTTTNYIPSVGMPYSIFTGSAGSSYSGLTSYTIPLIAKGNKVITATQTTLWGKPHSLSLTLSEINYLGETNIISPANRIGTFKNPFIDLPYKATFNVDKITSQTYTSFDGIKLFKSQSKAYVSTLDKLESILPDSTPTYQSNGYGTGIYVSFDDSIDLYDPTSIEKQIQLGKNLEKDTSIKRVKIDTPSAEPIDISTPSGITLQLTKVVNSLKALSLEQLLSLEDTQYLTSFEENLANIETAKAGLSTITKQLEKVMEKEKSLTQQRKDIYKIQQSIVPLETSLTRTTHKDVTKETTRYLEKTKPYEVKIVKNEMDITKIEYIRTEYIPYDPLPYDPIPPLPVDPIPPIPSIPSIGGGWDNRGYHTSNKQIRGNLLERRVEVASVSAGVFGVRTRALKGTSFDSRFEAVKSKPYSTIKVSRLGENKMPQAVLPKERKKKKVLKTTGFKMPSFKNPKF
jgi:hypothetical protein